MTKWNASVLIALGFSLGGTLGAGVAAQWVPPVKDQPFLETYSGLIAAFVAAGAAGIVVWQILSASAQHKALMLADRRRSIDYWKRTDGMLADVSRDYLEGYQGRLAEIYTLNPGFEKMFEDY